MKIIFKVFVLMLFLQSCEGPVLPPGEDDDNNNNVTEKTLEKVTTTFNNTGNTGETLFEGGNRETISSQTGAININRTEHEYYSNFKMKKYSLYDTADHLNNSYTFIYNNNTLERVDDYDSEPFFTYEPVNQERLISWTGTTTMHVPLLVDNEVNDYEDYDFTFNAQGLISNYKITDSEGEVIINANITYDANQNPIHVSGFYVFFEEENIDITFEYDSKVNPYYPFYNTYYKENLIILGARQGSIFNMFPLISNINIFAKNNTTKVTTIDAGITYTNTINYTYTGSYPLTKKLKQNGTVMTTDQFHYAD
jgi:hypothetical protein